jgi:hypothetical protein
VSFEEGEYRAVWPWVLSEGGWNVSGLDEMVL